MILGGGGRFIHLFEEEFSVLLSEGRKTFLRNDDYLSQFPTSFQAEILCLSKKIAVSEIDFIICYDENHKKFLEKICKVNYKNKIKIFNNSSLFPHETEKIEYSGYFSRYLSPEKEVFEKNNRQVSSFDEYEDCDIPF